MHVLEWSGDAEVMLIVEIGLWVRLKRSFDGSAKNESVSSISKNIWAAPVIVLLIGNPSVTNSLSFKSLCVAVHIRQLAPPAPERIADIFPSNIDRMISTITKPPSIDRLSPSFDVSGLIISSMKVRIFSSHSFAAHRKIGRCEKGVGRNIFPTNFTWCCMYRGRFQTKQNEILCACVGVLLVIDSMTTRTI